MSVALLESPRAAAASSVRDPALPRHGSTDCPSTAAHPANDPLSLPAPAPPRAWQRLLEDTLLVGGATAVGHVLGAATALVLRAALDPASMGIWQGLKVLLGYANYTNLGVSKAAARELTIGLGRGDALPAERSLNLAYTVNTVSSGLYAVALAAAIVWQSWPTIARGEGLSTLLADGWTLGLLVVAALAMLQRHATFQITLLRCRQDFRSATLLTVQEAVLTLAVAGAGAWLAGLRGLYGGTIVVLLASLWFLRRRQPAVFRWAWNAREIGRLIAFGSPLLAASVAASLFASLDKLMILGYLSDGAMQLGCYSVALMVAAQLAGFGNMLSIAGGPRYGHTFGRTGSRRETARMAARISEVQAAVLALLGGIALVVAPPLLSWLLPEYRPGLPALAWLLPGAILASLALPASQYAATVDGGRRVLAALAVGICAAAAGNHLALGRGAGIVGVAMATAAANGLYFLVLVRITIWKELPPRDRLRYVAMIALALLPTMGLAWALHAASGAEARGGIVAAQSAAVLAIWSLTVAVGWRYGGWNDWRGTNEGAGLAVAEVQR